jgi:hypothetical protein
MERLRGALASPWPALAFAQIGTGPKAIAARFGLDGDLAGSYTLIDGTRPVYVGVSRSVLARVRQHVLGRSHFHASLAYLIAQRRLPTKGHRSKNTEVPEFRAAFAGAQEYLRGSTWPQCESTTRSSCTSSRRMRRWRSERRSGIRFGRIEDESFGSEAMVCIVLDYFGAGEGVRLAVPVARTRNESLILMAFVLGVSTA